MEGGRAAAALLSLAALLACSAAAPVNEHTGLDVYDGGSHKDGCYYNFQHYGEGDRIMTNEPCLNCTCHNRMLMCYLRVCPFTKPIGQDCTIEKRGDQCCPVITCPDVHVDLLTSTSTTSPAEYGSSDVGHLEKFGCSINGKFFSEGSKVPPIPNKPCELCYCIRNMTACVMQECTLHVDGCTPVYQKDVCCPVRYSCDHPEDEILMLDDMTTTVRPTPGFLLTTTGPPGVTQDCIHKDGIFADGALIKTEKACEHCYCMKGDIVCVVQECGTPMENEGKNCTSLPPRIGQCCPDTYICENDLIEDTTSDNLLTTFMPTYESSEHSESEGSGEGDYAATTQLPAEMMEGSGVGNELAFGEHSGDTPLVMTPESISQVTDTPSETVAEITSPAAQSNESKFEHEVTSKQSVLSVEDTRTTDKSIEKSTEKTSAENTVHNFEDTTTASILTERMPEEREPSLQEITSTENSKKETLTEIPLIQATVVPDDTLVTTETSSEIETEVSVTKIESSSEYTATTEKAIRIETTERDYSTEQLETQTTYKIKEQSTEKLDTLLTEKHDETSPEKDGDKSTEKIDLLATEKVNDQSTERPEFEFTDNLDEHSTEKLFDQSTDKTEILKAQSTDRPYYDFTEKINELSTDKANDQSTDVIDQLPTEKHEEQSTERPENQFTEKLSEDSTQELDQSTEKIDTLPTEKLKEQSTERPDYQFTENIDEHSTEKLKDQSTETINLLPTEKVNDQSTERPDYEFTEKLDEHSTEKLDEHSTEKLFDHYTEKPYDQSTEKIEQLPTEKIEEQSTERDEHIVTENLDEHYSESPIDQSTEKINQLPTEKLLDKSTERPDYQFTETLDEHSTKKLDDESTENPDDNFTENPEDHYTVKIVYENTSTIASSVPLQVSQHTTILPGEEEQPPKTMQPIYEQNITTPDLPSVDVSLTTETSSASEPSVPSGEFTEVPDEQMTTIILPHEEFETTHKDEIPEVQQTMKIPEGETTLSAEIEEFTTISMIHDIPETTQDSISTAAEKTDKEHEIVTTESTTLKYSESTKVPESQPEDILTTEKIDEDIKDYITYKPTLIAESTTIQQPEESSKSSFEGPLTTLNAADYNEGTTESLQLEEKVTSVSTEVKPESETSTTVSKPDSTNSETFEKTTVLTETSGGLDSSTHYQEEVSLTSTEPSKEATEVDVTQSSTPEKGILSEVISPDNKTSDTDTQVTKINEAATLSTTYILEEVTTSTDQLELSTKQEQQETTLGPQFVSFSTTMGPEGETEGVESVSTSDDTTTTSVLDLSENEIHEEEPNVILPHIPGEGDCLVDGTTYTNDSLIPNSNKCQTACRCVSSIVKCEPVECSPPPENMINCQPMYYAKESCCPTYVCDHSKETVAPESHNQMLDVTSEQPSIDKKTEISTQSGITETPPLPDCSSEDCHAKEEDIVSVQVPELCSSEGCVPLPGKSSVPSRASDEAIPGKMDEKQTPSCTSGDCSDQQNIPVAVDTTEECTNNSCAPTKKDSDKIPYPTPSEHLPSMSESMSTQEPVKPLDKNCTDENCAKPEINVPEIQEHITVTHEPSSEDCEGDDCELSVSKVPEIQVTVAPCEGDQCEASKIKEPIQTTGDCSGEECKIPATETPQAQETVVPCEGDQCDGTKIEVPVQPSEDCTGEECKTPVTESPQGQETVVPCEGNQCDGTKIEVPVQPSEDCSGEECKTPATETPQLQETVVPCEGDQCDGTKIEVPIQPAEDCSGEECKTPATEAPKDQETVVPCEGDQCGGTKIEVPVQPSEDCTGEECKTAVTESPHVEETVVPCEGDQCDGTKIEVPVQPSVDCSGEECKIPATETPQLQATTVPCEGDQCDGTKIEVPVQPSEDCSGEECKTPATETPQAQETVVPCKGDQCDDTKIEVPVQPSEDCTGEECKIPATETPQVQETAVPCEGDQCDGTNIEVSVQPSEDCYGEECKTPPTETPQVQETVVPCEGDQCDGTKIGVPVQPAEDCSGEECKTPFTEIPDVQATVVPCEGDQCDGTKVEVPVQPTEDCTGEECRPQATEIPQIKETVVPCEGDQCGGTKIEVPVQPSEDCTGKECKTPVTESPDVQETVVPCEGDQCDSTKIEVPVQPSVDCSGEECKTPATETPQLQETIVPCEGDQCDGTKIEVPVQPTEDCSGEECKTPATETPQVQEPVVPCEGDRCDGTKFNVPVQPNEDCTGEECKTPATETPQLQETIDPCEGDQCDSTKIEVPVQPSEDCTGEECKTPFTEIPHVQATVVPCEGDQCDGTKVEVPVQPTEDCTGEECETLFTETPHVQETVVPCEGDLCDGPKIEVPVQPSEDCIGEECKIPATETPQVQETVVPCEGDQCDGTNIEVSVQPSEDCNGEECKTPSTETPQVQETVVSCEGDQCGVTKVEVPVKPSKDCIGEECKSPVSETPEIQKTVVACDGDQCDVPNIEELIQPTQDCSGNECKLPVSETPQIQETAGSCEGDHCETPKSDAPVPSIEDCKDEKCDISSSKIPENQSPVDVPCDGDQCNAPLLPQNPETLPISESVPAITDEVTESQFVSTITTRQSYDATTAIYSTTISDQSQNEIDGSSQQKPTTEQDVMVESSTSEIKELESITKPTTISEMVVTENVLKEKDDVFNEIPTESVKDTSGDYSSTTHSSVTDSLLSDKETTQKTEDKTEDNFTVTIPSVNIEHSTASGSIATSTAASNEFETKPTNEFTVTEEANKMPTETEQEAYVTSEQASSGVPTTGSQEFKKTTKDNFEQAPTENYADMDITTDDRQQQTESTISTKLPVELQTTISDKVSEQTIYSTTPSDNKTVELPTENITKSAQKTTTAYSVELEQHTHAPQEVDIAKPTEAELSGVTNELVVTEKEITISEPELTTDSVLREKEQPSIESHVVETETPHTIIEPSDVESSTLYKITDEPIVKEPTDKPADEIAQKPDFTMQPSKETVLSESPIGLTEEPTTSERTTAASTAQESTDDVTEKEKYDAEITSPKTELDFEKTTDATEQSKDETEKDATLKPELTVGPAVFLENEHQTTVLPISEEYSTIIYVSETSSKQTAPFDRVSESEQPLTTPATSSSESFSETIPDTEQTVTKDSEPHISDQPHEETKYETTEPAGVIFESTTQASTHIPIETMYTSDELPKSTEIPDTRNISASEEEITFKTTTVLPSQPEEGSGLTDQAGSVTLLPEASITPVVVEEDAETPHLSTSLSEDKLDTTNRPFEPEKDSPSTESGLTEPSSVDASGRRTVLPSAQEETSTEAYATLSPDIKESHHTYAPEEHFNTTSPIQLELDTTISEQKITVSTSSPGLTEMLPSLDGFTSQTEIEYSSEVFTVTPEKEISQKIPAIDDVQKTSEELSTIAVPIATDESTTIGIIVPQEVTSEDVQGITELLTTSRPSGASMTQSIPEEETKSSYEQTSTSNAYESSSSVPPLQEGPLTEKPVSVHTEPTNQEIIPVDVTTKLPVVTEESEPGITEGLIHDHDHTVKTTAQPTVTEIPDKQMSLDLDVTKKPELSTDENTHPAATTATSADEEQKPTVSDELPGSTGPSDLPSPGEDVDHQSPEQFPSPGYGGEPDYEEEDQPFGPGTCRYSGKVYVSAQQIPRDDPCDFCFCFRSDIICLQQSCPPPIKGCHEEPISGFCCPRYECHVSMSTTLNVTTTTTTTTTTLPPHFLPHAYKGAAQRRGCQIKGHSYQVGEVVRASSGPCLHCTCGGDGQMKCDPKVCTPEPMLRQMIAAAVSTKRRR